MYYPVGSISALLKPAQLAQTPLSVLWPEVDWTSSWVDNFSGACKQITSGHTSSRTCNPTTQLDQAWLFIFSPDAGIPACSGNFGCCDCIGFAFALRGGT